MGQRHSPVEPVHLKFAPLVTTRCLSMFRIKNNFHCSLVVFLLVTVQFHTIDCQQGALQKEFHRDVVSDLATFLFDCWNNFVPMMSTGIPNLKIPILDPWHSKTIPFQIQDSDLKASASF